MLKGTVTITLEDYHSLIESDDKSLLREDNLKLAARELQVFLSFLCEREDLSNYLEEFNKQSKTSSINVVNGRAQIKINEKVI